LAIYKRIMKILPYVQTRIYISSISNTFPNRGSHYFLALSNTASTHVVYMCI